MSRALLKFNGGSVHDYATIADDSPLVLFWVDKHSRREPGPVQLRAPSASDK